MCIRDSPHPYDQVSFDNKVRHVGDRVAAVAADSEEIAAEACRLIKVTYEVLPAVFDEREALKPGAPVIHDEDDTEHIRDASLNKVHWIFAERGDVEKALAEAPHYFEQTFRVHQVQQCPMEPHVAVAWLDEDERMVIRTATQVPFHVRRMIAPLIEMPVRDIRVIKPRIGGGFGAKQEMLIEDIVALLAIRTRRPVRLVLTREEEFISARTRHPQTLTYRTGVAEDGTLIAQDPVSYTHLDVYKRQLGRRGSRPAGRDGVAAGRGRHRIAAWRAEGSRARRGAVHAARPGDHRRCRGRPGPRERPARGAVGRGRLRLSLIHI